MLSHERLDVYQAALEFLGFTRRLVAAAPRGHADLLDQLGRAARSVVLNIAEAAGRTAPRERHRHWTVARGSALECGACLDVLRVEELAPEALLDSGKLVLVRVVAMLTKMLARG